MDDGRFFVVQVWPAMRTRPFRAAVRAVEETRRQQFGSLLALCRFFGDAAALPPADGLAAAATAASEATP